VGKTGRPGPTLDDYLYWQERLKGRGGSGLSIDELCLDEGVWLPPIFARSTTVTSAIGSPVAETTSPDRLIPGSDMTGSRVRSTRGAMSLPLVRPVMSAETIKLASIAITMRIMTWLPECIWRLLHLYA